jgi:hypothetical protein
VEDWTLRSGNWLVEGLLLSEDADVQVSAKLVGSDTLIVALEAGAAGYFGTVLTLRIHHAAEPSLSDVEVSGSWYTDVGPPFDGAVEILDGEVVLNTLAWEVGASVQVLFELHGSKEQEPWCVHGQVRAAVEAG